MRIRSTGLTLFMGLSILVAACNSGTASTAPSAAAPSTAPTTAASAPAASASAAASEAASIPPATSDLKIGVVTDVGGKFVARLDFGIPAAQLGIEGHSREFHFGPLHEEADEGRDLRVTACGWELIYLGWYAQRRPADIVELIAQTCRTRIARRSA